MDESIEKEARIAWRVREERTSYEKRRYWIRNWNYGHGHRHAELGQCTAYRNGPVPDRHGNHRMECDPWRVLDVVGGKKMHIAVIIVVLLVVLFGTMIVNASAIEEDGPVQPEYKKMQATAYCLTGQRCDGGAVRRGIASAAPKYYGMTAAVYINDGGQPGEFLGWYEILDTGENEGIQNGTVLDIWMPTYEECIEFGRKDVLVVFVEGVG